MVEQSAVDLPEIEMQTEAEVADDRDEVADSSQADSATNAETEPSKTESDSQSQSKPEPAKNEPERTDDGSVALALLEGRTPERSEERRVGKEGRSRRAASLVTTQKQRTVRALTGDMQGR